MIITIDAGRDRGSIIVEAWKHGIEVEKLHGNQLELFSGNDEKVEHLVSRFPSVKVLHKEKVKEVSIYDNPI